MGTIKFVDGKDVELVTAKREPNSRVAEGVSSFRHHPGSADEPELFETRYLPGTGPTPHAHVVDEIIVVTEGSIQVGNRTFGVGSSVFIPKMTLYSFKAGPEGLTFLNFRPSLGDVQVIYKDEFMAMRGEAAG